VRGSGGIWGDAAASRLVEKDSQKGRSKKLEKGRSGIFRPWPGKPLRDQRFAMRYGIPRLVSMTLLLALAVSSSPAFAARTSATDNSFSASHVTISDADKALFGRHEALFGSREIAARNLSPFPYWVDMLARTRAELSTASAICKRGQTRNCVPAEWHRLVRELSVLPLREKLKRANDAMNAHPYVTTRRNWHRAMYWEAPFQFLRRGGQCQDYAIAKYELLRQSGLPAPAMRMVVMRDTQIATDHAVLAVYVDGQALLFDNLNPRVVLADSVPFYRPYYSFNERNWWYRTGDQAMDARFLINNR
jgi:predicted transglutaminase-like cysteine proteinase